MPRRQPAGARRLIICATTIRPETPIRPRARRGRLRGEIHGCQPPGRRAGRPDRQAADRRPVRRVEDQRVEGRGEPRHAAGPRARALRHARRARRGGGRGRRGLQDVEERARGRAHARDAQAPGAHPPRHEEARRLPHRTSRARRSPTPRATSSAASRWSSTPAPWARIQMGEHLEQVAGGVDVYAIRQPIGVCVGITPFNFPAMIPLWMFPMAIVCGNTFVLKPSEQDPMTPMLLAELAHRGRRAAGRAQHRARRQGRGRHAVHAPGGARRLLRGLHATSATHVYNLASDARQARAMHDGREEPRRGAARTRPRTSRSTPSWARASAPPASAAWRSASRVLVGKANEWIPDIVAKAKTLKVSCGTEKGADLGPLISKPAHARVDRLIEAGVKEGAKLELDGRGLKVPGYPDGNFIGPTIFSGVKPSHDHLQARRSSARCCASCRVDTLDEAIAFINANPFGNGTGIFTQSGAAARKFQNEIDVGQVGINVPDPGAGALLQLHRLARLQAGRPRPLRQAGDAVLHAGEDGDGALVRRRGHRRRREHHHQPQVSGDEDRLHRPGAHGRPHVRATCSRRATRVKAYDVVPALVEEGRGRRARAGRPRSPTASPGVEVVITMLPSSPHVRTRLPRRVGRHRAARRRARSLVDCSTIDPLTAREVAFDAMAKGLAMVDAPVSGGVGGAEAGTLTFMVGGEREGLRGRQARPRLHGQEHRPLRRRAATGRWPRSATT